MTSADKTAMVVRWVATLLIIYMVYGETGPWTTVFCALVALGSEAQIVVNRLVFATSELVTLLARRP